MITQHFAPKLRFVNGFAESMKQAAEQLSREGFFDHLTPITQDDLVTDNPYQWPPQSPGKEESRAVRRN
jgi:hypothetical protein